MADISLTQEGFDDSDEGVYEQGDGFWGNQVDDSSLHPLFRIQKYAQSENKRDRSMIWRVLVDLFRSAPADTVTTSLPHIMSVVSKLADEGGEKGIRDALIDQIPNLSMLAKECAASRGIPALKTVVTEYFVPMLVRYLGAMETFVRKAAEYSLLSLMQSGLITKAEVEIQVCPTVLALSRDESVTDNHVVVITLMSKMATSLGRDVTERVFLDRFAQLCKNNTFYVRKACASHFGDFCAVVGKDAYEKVLLPCYVGLCSDDIWGVRKACAEVAVSVSCACPPPIRRRMLAPVFIKLLQDNSRWVRMSAFQTLGPFISTFADPAISTVFYDNAGELMSVNSDGREFRVNATATLQKLHNLMQDNSKEEPPLIFPEEDYDNERLLESIYQYHDSRSSNEAGPQNPGDYFLTGEGDEEESNALDLGLNVPEVSEISDPPDLLDQEKKREDIILQKNRNVVEKALMREETVGKNRMAMEELQMDADTGNEKGEQLKEIVETVKNALLTFRVAPDGEIKVVAEAEQEKSDSGVEVAGDSSGEILCDVDLSPSISDVSSLGNIPSLKSNSDATIVSSVCCETDRKSDCDEGVASNRDFPMKEPDEPTASEHDVVEPLPEYNSYNYWYVRPPDIPVDLSIVYQVPSQGTSKGESNQNLPKTASSPARVSDAKTNQPSGSREPIKYQANTKPDVPVFVFKDRIYPQAKEGEELEWQGVPKLLIAHFVSMTNPSLAQETDNDMAFHCAYALPAVALTLGSKNWHLLKETVEALASDMQYKVRRTVASSLHELAVILGPEIATDNLTPIFDEFIKDLDEVRIGVLKHLAHFLRLISPSKRNMYLPRFADFLQSDNELNWRYRQELAEQLRLAVPLFRPAEAAKHITSIAQVLLSDKVDAVRKTSLTLITDLLKHISTERDLTPRLLIVLAERFAHAKRWKRRQTFALLCSNMLAVNAIPIELFANDVMPHLMDLSWDPVANVRLVVARILSTQLITNPYFADPNNQFCDNLQTTLRRLQSDEDQDVRHSSIIENFTCYPMIH